MGAKVSENMKAALAAIMRKKDPLTPAEASREHDISQSAISMNATYRKFKESKANAKSK